MARSTSVLILARAPDGIVWSTAVQNDGKIVIGGDFMTYNEISSPHIARLNADGSFDATFNAVSGTDSTISAVALEQSAGTAQRIYIAGNFQYYNTDFCGRVARLNPDGTLDSTFFAGAGADGQIYALGLQSNGQLLLGGPSRVLIHASATTSPASIPMGRSTWLIIPGAGPITPSIP